ncbi:MAG: CDP-diacylglycerol--glycerol-3-phosphate 3-phosphatidyltransferase [Gammaproteobacteria bacterium]|nr:CDP-diacylglycerol--glycerol-3-phosphate 3-phosphatidyltransferase [Gammaproteobacteria bacterium]
MKPAVGIPNIVTSIRIILIPVLVGVYYLPMDWHYLAAAAIFTLASITDWLDGYLARRLQQMTPFGAFLDPVADKLIVAVALVMLVESHASTWLTIPALVIVGREIVVSALREWMAEMGKQASIAVSFLGKVKTTFQMIALIFLLANEPNLELSFVILGYALLYTAAALTLWSMYLYLRIAWPLLSSGMTDD